MFRHAASGNPECRQNLKGNRRKTRFPYGAKRAFPQRAELNPAPRTQQKPRKNFRAKTDFVKRLFPFLRGFFREHFLFYREPLFCLFGASRSFLPHPRFSFRHNRFIVHHRPKKTNRKLFSAPPNEQTGNKRNPTFSASWFLEFSFWHSWLPVFFLLR